MQSENTAGAENESEQQQAAPDEMQHLGELLAADEADAGASDDAESGSNDAAPTKFNELAGKLGIKLDDLYKLEIAQAEDGTPLTIENLKDAHGEKVDFSMREIEFEERRTKQESELMQAQEEMRELMAALPAKAIAPEVLQKIRNKQDAQGALERKLTLQVIPGWNDATVRKAEIDAMSVHMKQYGFAESHLARITDHRQIKYIRDNWQREQRIRKALAAVKPGKPNPTSKTKPAAKAPQKQPVAGVKRATHNKLLDTFSEL